MSKRRKEPRGINAYNKMFGIDERYTIIKFELRDGYTTNTTAENPNNSIKVMKRMSYGFSSFKRMRKRCLLALRFYRIVKRNLKLKKADE